MDLFNAFDQRLQRSPFVGFVIQELGFTSNEDLSAPLLFLVVLEGIADLPKIGLRRVF